MEEKADWVSHMARARSDRPASPSEVIVVQPDHILGAQHRHQRVGQAGVHCAVGLTPSRRSKVIRSGMVCSSGHSTLLA